MTISNYHRSTIKRCLDVILASLIFICTIPAYVFIALVIKLTSRGPVFFLQKRAGRNGKVFRIFKFRTMVVGADKLQGKYQKLNESDGPVFKIKNDPRFTKFGKLLSNTGLDELPQFINVMRGEMSIVGPRPLPVSEARRLSKIQNIRTLVNPGITSNWVVGGSHKLSFKKWMELDAIYVKTATFTTDLRIIFSTFLLMIHFLSQLQKTIDQSLKKN